MSFMVLGTVKYVLNAAPLCTLQTPVVYWNHSKYFGQHNFQIYEQKAQVLKYHNSALTLKVLKAAQQLETFSVFPQ